MRRALADAEQRTHTELAHRRDVEHFNADPELGQTCGSPGEFPRKEHIARFVDEIAGEHDAVGNRQLLRPGLLRRCRIGTGEVELDFAGPLLVLLTLGFIEIEGVGAQPCPERQFCDLIGLQRACAEFRKDRGVCSGRRHLSHGDAAELDDIARFQLAFLADAHHHETRYIEAGRGNDIEARAALASKAVGCSRPANEISERRQRPLCRRTEFEIVFAEHNKNAVWAGERGEIKFEGGGHGASFGSIFCGSGGRGWGLQVMNRTGRPCKAAFSAKIRAVPRRLYQTRVLTL